MPSTTKALILGGGGMKGAAYIGLLEQLDLSDCHVFVGVSVGAVFGLACALGYTAAELEAFARTHHASFNGMATKKKITQLHLLDRGPLLAFVTDLLREKGFSTKLTFAHLQQYLGQSLHVLVTPLVEDADDPTGPGVFSPARTPDVPVCAAVLASTSFPLLFPPMRIGGRRYLDGALSCGLGGCIAVVRESHPDICETEILAVQLRGNDIKVGLGYAGQLLDLMVRLLKRDDVTFSGATIALETNVSATGIPASWAGWQKVIQVGRNAVFPK